MTHALDQDWLAGHPLPVHADKTDKNSRGRVLVVGGSCFVPGALRLTGEAALRAGAGKLQLATVRDVALHLGVLVPEAAMIALLAADDGEIDQAAVPAIARAVEHCDAFVLGPGMSETSRTAALVAAVLAQPRDGLSIVLDAAAIGACSSLAERVRAHGGRAVMTPHHGEMAALTGLSTTHIGDNDEVVAREVAVRFGAVVVLKADQSVIATPDGTVVRYDGGGVGLATGGSGDVLAGLIGGLIARGAAPPVAAAWGVWIHGEAGRSLANAAPIGFLARELVPLIPRIMASVRPAARIGF